MCENGYCLRRADESLHSADLSTSTEVVKSCRRELHNLTGKDRYKFLATKVEAALTIAAASATVKKAKTDTNRVKSYKQKYQFLLDIPGSDKMLPVCRRAFCLAYGISHYVLDNVSKEVKQGHKGVDGETFTDRSAANYSYVQMSDIAKKFGITLSKRQTQVRSRMLQTFY